MTTEFGKVLIIAGVMTALLTMTSTITTANLTPGGPIETQPAPLNPWTYKDQDQRGLVWDRTIGVWVHYLSPAAKARIALLLHNDDGSHSIQVYADIVRMSGPPRSGMEWCEYRVYQYGTRGVQAECVTLDPSI